MQNIIVSLGLLIVFAVVTLLLMREGLWSAMVMFLNVLLAASVATAWYEVLANWMETLIPSYTYLLDFLAIWSIFSVLVLVLREITDRVSRTKVKFLRQVELIGAPAMAMLTGWVMVAFTAASLHTAALPREFVQPKPQTRMLFGLAPDRKWLSWVRNGSRAGPFAQAEERSVFDKDADFILRYADRRKTLESQESLRVLKP